MSRRISAAAVALAVPAAAVAAYTAALILWAAFVAYANFILTHRGAPVYVAALVGPTAVGALLLSAAVWLRRRVLRWAVSR